MCVCVWVGVLWSAYGALVVWVEEGRDVSKHTLTSLGVLTLPPVCVHTQSRHACHLSVCVRARLGSQPIIDVQADSLSRTRGRHTRRALLQAAYRKAEGDRSLAIRLQTEPVLQTRHTHQHQVCVYVGICVLCVWYGLCVSACLGVFSACEDEEAPQAAVRDAIRAVVVTCTQQQDDKHRQIGCWSSSVCLAVSRCTHVGCAAWSISH